MALARLGPISGSGRATKPAESRGGTVRCGGRPGDVVDVLMADLASQASVRHLAAEVLERYPSSTAREQRGGISRGVSEPRRIELTWALTPGAAPPDSPLLERLEAGSRPARIVTTTSGPKGATSVSRSRPERRRDPPRLPPVASQLAILFTSEALASGSRDPDRRRDLLPLPAGSRRFDDRRPDRSP